ncbi:hypothetical protein HPP92_022050 [Vanilla planifolia]|uniref:Nudix hydrolase domain-containing protein n=1 Tax=Vanilla planifolia TaxID=51239 RepID=A0A835UBW1_VANPL|nr:hypothetical protein HPP92_022381 [Vanilla planifolia]KAG0458922.1 hypothetical protein HPP92_022050 [Vanilla planifolia]
MTLPPPRLPAVKLTGAFLSSIFPSPSHPDLLLLFAAALSFFFVCKNTSSSPPSLLQLRRRSLSSPSMTRPPPPPPATIAFSSPESLSDWLKTRLPHGALSSWGVSPGTKTIQNLWIELSQGETSLLLPSPPDEVATEFDAVPLRAVNVATVWIRNGRGSVLVESHQLLSDGSVRHRGRPLSEKMRPGETVEEAARRAVEEELGTVADGRVRIVPGSYNVRVEEKSSASYPGLPARYVLHSVEAQVDGLPEDGEFSTEEVGEGVEGSSNGSAVFVRKHFWKWVHDYGDGHGNDYGQQQ